MAVLQQSREQRLLTRGPRRTRRRTTFATPCAAEAAPRRGWHQYSIFAGDRGTAWTLLAVAAAIAVAAVPALLLEWRLVRFAPAAPRWPGVLTKVPIGVLGIAPLLAVDRATGEQALYLEAAMAGVATLWALLGAPALFRAGGWGEHRARDAARYVRSQPERRGAGMRSHPAANRPAQVDARNRVHHPATAPRPGASTAG